MVYLIVYIKKKEGKKNRKENEKHITHRKERKQNKKIKLKVEVSSLTCLFVYKVLNQEVLDDRGKFEVSLVKK